MLRTLGVRWTGQGRAWLPVCQFSAQLRLPQRACHSASTSSAWLPHARVAALSPPIRAASVWSQLLCVGGVASFLAAQLVWGDGGQSKRAQ